MSEIVVETTPSETVIEIEGGPTLTTTVTQELQTLVETPAETVVIDLNSGARGEPGSAILTGEAYPTLLMGSIGDLFIVTEGDVGVGDVYVKTVLGWVNSGNIRGPAGGIDTVNGYPGPDVDLNKADIGLDQVDNTSDLNKPVSTATQTALDTKSDVGHLHPISDVTGLQDELDTTVRLTGAQTIAGTKTFSDAPVVPNSSFTISKTQSLQATLDEKVTLATAQTIASRKAFRVDSTDVSAIGGATIEVRNDTGNPRVTFHKNLVRLAQIRMLDSGTFEFANSAGTGLVDVSAAVITASTGFSGPGGSLTGLNATNLSSGTVSDARLSTNVVLLNNAQTVTGAKTFTGAIIVPAPTADTHASTKKYVDDAITLLTNGSPELLNTLDELAAALGDDPNFATTMTNSLATKVSLTGDQTIAGVKTLTGDTYITRLRSNSTIQTQTDAALGGTAGDIIITKRHTHFGSTNQFHLVDMLHRRTAGTDWMSTQWYQGVGVDGTFQQSPTTGTAGQRLRTWILRDPQNSSVALGDAGNTYLTATATAITAGSGVIFTGSGAGLTALPATSLTGTIDVARMPSTVVLTTGAQTIAGVKTFSSSPVVPDDSFAIAKTAGLTTALAERAKTINLTYAPSGGNWIRVASINGSTSSTGASMSLMVSGQGGLGNLLRATTIIHFSQRGDNAYAFEGFTLGTTSPAMTWHVKQISTYVFELWMNRGSFQGPISVTALTVAGGTGTAFLMDSETTSAPSGLIAQTVPLNITANAVQRVVHNGTSWPARPAGATYVEWVGPTAPGSATSNDTWVNTST